MIKLFGNKSLRSIGLKLLRIISRDIQISHHWTKDPILLNLYLHKGYWFHGKNRELETIKWFYQNLTKSKCIIEIGGHIGYLSLIFSDIVKPSPHGVVYVFEPGSNNIKYIENNLSKKSNIHLIRKGCGNENHTASFYEDNLTGQNNSFVKDFQGLQRNSENAPSHSLEVKENTVQVVRVDEELGDVAPDFIKIDTEGYEWFVLQGCAKFLESTTSKPKLMVEIQSHQEEIYNYLIQRGYKLCMSNGTEISSYTQLSENVFAIPSSTT